MMKRQNKMCCILILLGILVLPELSLGCEPGLPLSALSYSPLKPQIIRMDLPVDPSGVDDGAGGLIAADLDNNGNKDFIVTKPGWIAAYKQDGRRLWKKESSIRLTSKSEDQGLPGLHAPGVQGADVDGDGAVEVLFLTGDGILQILRGLDGESKGSFKLEPPKGVANWEHLVVADFRGKGDSDILLQATNAQGYRMGSYLAAYSLEGAVESGRPELLWKRDDFLANAHNGARVADLDGDGKDEVLGGTIVGPEGDIRIRIPLRGHIDSIFVADIRPDIPGLEVIALEEGPFDRILSNHNRLFMSVNRMYRRYLSDANRVFLYNVERLIWESHYRHWEPQNATLGDFDPARPGLEVWCRSRFDTHQKPFAFDAQGRFIAQYEMDSVAPQGWTDAGVELIFAIDWTGASKQLAVAKERHKQGDVAIFDPISGEFLHRFKEKADRLYVADVIGDWREEVIVVNGNEIRIYRNDEENPNPDRRNLWLQNHYRRSKMTWNYYSP